MLGFCNFGSLTPLGTKPNKELNNFLKTHGNDSVWHYPGFLSQFKCFHPPSVFFIFVFNEVHIYSDF